MRLRRSAAIVLRQIYLIRGSASRVFPLFGWVAIDITLWGFITKYLNQITASGLDFVASLLGGVLIWNFMMRVMQGVTIAFFEDVWSRNFLNFFASPLTISEYLGGLVVTSVATGLLGFLAMLALASVAFGLSLLAYGVLLVPFLLVLFVFGISLGIFGAAVVLRLGPSAEWFVWPISAVLAPFAGVFYPVSTLPGPMQYVARALPPSYIFEGMRAVVTGGSVSASSLLIGGGLAAVSLALTSWMFVRVYRHGVRTGLIARYSAESVA